MSSITIVNPCNDEQVRLAGPVKATFHSTQDHGGGRHYGVHLTFKGTGVGDQGNDYRVSLVANAQLDAPSGSLDFVVPFHAEVISRGSAPNLSFEGTLSVIVTADGRVVDATVSSVTAVECHG